jgi:hypothetical protein
MPPNSGTSSRPRALTPTCGIPSTRGSS